MASYSLTRKTSTQDFKGTAQDRSDYINREGKYARIKKLSEQLLYKENTLPKWANNNPHEFFKASEEFERSNGTTFLEIRFALPNELSLEEQKNLIREFIDTQLPNKAVSWAIHDKIAALDSSQKNIHVHIIYSDRLEDGIERTKEQYFKKYNPDYPEKGGCKKDPSWRGDRNFGREKLIKLREANAKIQNKYLEQAGHHSRVDHRSLKEQRKEALAMGDVMKAKELDRLPEQHLGPHKIKDYNNSEMENVILLRQYRKAIKEVHEEYLQSILTVKNEADISSDAKNNTQKINAGFSKEYLDLATKTDEVISQVKEYKRGGNKRHAEMAVNKHVNFCLKLINALDNDLKTLREAQRRAYSEILSPEKTDKIALFIFTYGETALEKLAQIKEALEKPAAQEKLALIKANILEKNRPERELAEKLNWEINNLLGERKNIEGLINQIKPSVKITQISNDVESAVNEPQIQSDSLPESREFNRVELQFINKICNDRLAELREQGESLLDNARQENKKVFSEKRAFEMAVSVYLKSEYKNVYEDAQKFKKFQEELTQKEKEFAQKPKPGFLQFKYKSEYNQEAHMLAVWRSQYTKGKSENDALLRSLREKIKETTDPKIQEKLRTIQENILKKNQPQREKTEKLWVEYKALKQEREEILAFKKQIKPYLKNNNFVSVSPPAQGINDLNIKGVLRQADNIVSQLAQANGGGVGLTARIRDEDDERSIKYSL